MEHAEPRLRAHPRELVDEDYDDVVAEVRDEIDALEVFAESLRTRRHQQAEEQGHKAAVKLLFPTLVCIFPAMFVVILGPALIQIVRTLQGM